MKGDNCIKIANAQIYVLIGMFFLVIAGVTYSTALPALINHEWAKIVVFIVLLFLVLNIIRIRFRTVPLSIVFDGNKVKIRSMFGVREYPVEEIVGLEYSGMGRMYPRHFLAFRNGDIYDIVNRKSAEKIDAYLDERKK